MTNANATNATNATMPNYPAWGDNVSAVLADGLYCHGRGEAQLFSFGAYGSTRLLYFAESDDLSDGLEVCAAWLLTHEPHHLVTPELSETKDGRCITPVEGKDGITRPTDWVGYTESGWLCSWEWSATTVGMGEALRFAAETASYGAWRPDISTEAFWAVENGEDVYPCDYFSREEVSEEEGVDVSDVEVCEEPIHARLIMPGYLDATDWVGYTDWAECFAALIEEADSLLGE